MDTILREVHGVNRLFGGMWVLACGDPYQNEPVKEQPPLQSWFVRHHFQVVCLKEVFRARSDALLSKMIVAMRQPILDAGTVNFILAAIETGCTP